MDKQTTPHEVLRVNYFVGGLLAQGGNLWIDDGKVLFTPTSALDRAMGAKNVEIPFAQIKQVESAGGLFRSFKITTSEKTHKFEGNQAKHFCEMLEKALPDKSVFKTKATALDPIPIPLSHPAGNGLSCGQCSRSLHPGFVFCPYCGTRIKSVCSSCSRSVEPGWAACAFCGHKFSLAA